MPPLPHRSAFLRALVAAALTVLAGASIGPLRAHVAELHAAQQTPEDVYYLPASHAVLRVLTLGFYEASADLLWMKALLYYGESISQRSEAAYTMDYAEALIALDPGLTRAYQWAGMVPFYLTVETPLALRERSAQLVMEGSDLHPADGPLAWGAASTVTYELLPYITDAARRQYWEEASARLLERAVHLEAGPAWLSLNAATALQGLGRADAAMRSLNFAYSVTSDPDLRSNIAARIQAIQRTADQLYLETEHRRLTTQRTREFPYLGPALYLLIGPRQMPAPGF